MKCIIFNIVEFNNIFILDKEYDDSMIETYSSIEHLRMIATAENFRQLSYELPNAFEIHAKQNFFLE